MATTTNAAALRALGPTLALVLACGLGGCAWTRTQLWPEPMRDASDPLPPGDAASHPPGPEEVSVLRHADPVRVRPAGALSGYPLAFFNKRTRLTAGGSVIVAPGGRVEVVWPSGSSVVLFGQGIGWVGSPSRGEPIFQFQDLDRARLDLMPGDRVELLGGAVLSGDSGPYMLDRVRAESLRLRNQSKASVRLAFREEIFELDPGQSLMIPLLSEGGGPRAVDPGLQRVNGPGFVVHVRGPVDVRPEPSGVEVRAVAEPAGERRVEGLGVVVRLGPGERAVLSGLGAGRAAPAASPGAAGAPRVP